MRAVFGPAGSSLEFKNLKSVSLSQYLESLNLKAYEYQCGRGVRIGEQKAAELGKSLRNISVSVHSPYYVSLSSLEQEKRKKSVDYILKTAIVANLMGARRVVVHSGSCKNLKREEALNLAKQTLKEAFDALKNEGLQNISICPETMGKTNQLGNLQEVLELCKISETFVPCVDFGHLNARSFGSIKTEEDYLKIFDEIENSLGFERLKTIHIHFSKIEFCAPGGEKKHLTFEDGEFGPPFEPLLEIVAKKGLFPTVICESCGTQGQDAKAMQSFYESLFN